MVFYRRLGGIHGPEGPVLPARLSLVCAGLVWLLAYCGAPMMVCAQGSVEWKEAVSETVWAAYTPPSGNPNAGIEATAVAIQEDLAVLLCARFTGLVTYSSTGIMGRELPQIAQDAGFKGLILGIWDPNDQQEIAAAVTAASNPIVLGYCVGNEGLGQRYSFERLSTAIQYVRDATGKPVTTAEQYGDYSDGRLFRLGDWVFPTVHPYFYNVREPSAAVRWTKAAWDELKKRRGERFVLLKEVGLPTAGDPEGEMSEAAQEQYYLELAKTDVRFVYFEAFDQPWKTHLPIEPHWGIFRADRTPKLLAARLLGRQAQLEATRASTSTRTATRRTITLLPAVTWETLGTFEWTRNPGRTPTRATVASGWHTTPEGRAREAIPLVGAGVYWLEPADNWGRTPELQGRGYDLSGYTRLTFWARAEQECIIEFKVGGIDGPYGDSLRPARQVLTKLGQQWQQYEIDLSGANLECIIGGFCWVTNWDTNPKGAVFYLDSIRFER